jgi:hypothetical protein
MLDVIWKFFATNQFLAFVALLVGASGWFVVLAQ